MGSNLEKTGKFLTVLGGLLSIAKIVVGALSKK